MHVYAARRFASLVEDLLPSTCQPLAVSQKVPALPQCLEPTVGSTKLENPKVEKSWKVQIFWRFHEIIEFFPMDLSVACNLQWCLEANLTPSESQEYLNFNRDLENRRNSGEWWEFVKWDSWKPCIFSYFFYNHALHDPTSSLLLSCGCHCCWVFVSRFHLMFSHVSSWITVNQQ